MSQPGRKKYFEEHASAERFFDVREALGALSHFDGENSARTSGAVDRQLVGGIGAVEVIDDRSEGIIAFSKCADLLRRDGSCFFFPKLIAVENACAFVHEFIVIIAKVTFAHADGVPGIELRIRTGR